jgi:Flp pilus assembly pilin Flp
VRGGGDGARRVGAARTSPGQSAEENIMQRTWKLLRRFVHAEHGQDLIEYGMLAALIAVVAVTAVTTLGYQIRTVLWETIVTNF